MTALFFVAPHRPNNFRNSSVPVPSVLPHKARHWPNRDDDDDPAHFECVDSGLFGFYPACVAAVLSVCLFPISLILDPKWGVKKYRGLSRAEVQQQTEAQLEQEWLARERCVLDLTVAVCVLLRVWGFRLFTLRRWCQDAASRRATETAERTSRPQW